MKNPINKNTTKNKNPQNKQPSLQLKQITIPTKITTYITQQEIPKKYTPSQKMKKKTPPSQKNLGG